MISPLLGVSEEASGSGETLLAQTWTILRTWSGGKDFLISGVSPPGPWPRPYGSLFRSKDPMGVRKNESERERKWLLPNIRVQMGRLFLWSTIPKVLERRIPSWDAVLEFNESLLHPCWLLQEKQIPYFVDTSWLLSHEGWAAHSLFFSFCNPSWLQWGGDVADGRRGKGKRWYYFGKGDTDDLKGLWDFECIFPVSC